jgi:probable HAF family extracellular repeat protein
MQEWNVVPTRPTPELGMRRIPLSAAAACVLASAALLPAAPVRYRVTDLGSLGGEASATAIDESGLIAGWSAGPNGDDIRPVLWRDGAATDLGLPDGYVNGRARDVNAAGQVVGMLEHAGDLGEAPFLYDNGVIRNLNDLLPAGSGWTLQRANAINARGQIVGAGINPAGQFHAYLFEPGGPVLDLGTFGGESSEARDINDAGRVVGYAQVPFSEVPRQDSSTDRAFVYDAGTMFKLDLPGSWDASQATAVSPAGIVAGDLTYPDLILVSDAFFYFDGATVFPLGLPGEVGHGSDVNDAGQVIGSFAFFDSDEEPGKFLFDGSEVLRLDDLIAPEDAGWEIEFAAAIDNAGRIVGSAVGADGVSRAVLLTPLDGGPAPTPIPLPPAAPAGLAAVATLLAVRRAGRRPGR